MRDFNPMFASFQILLHDQDVWEVCDNEVFSVSNMSDEEIRQAIVTDVLMVTMWEIQSGEEVTFTVQTLMRKLGSEKLCQRVRTQLHHPEISGLFAIRPVGTIRLRKDVAVLQAAMDYAGIWYSGFSMPAGAIVVVGEPMFEGEIEQLAVNIHGQLKSNLH